MKKILIVITLITLLLLTTFTEATYILPTNHEKSFGQPQKGERLKPIEERKILGDPNYEFTNSKIKLDGQMDAWGGILWFWFPPLFIPAEKRFLILGGDYTHDKFDLMEGTITIKPLFGEMIILHPNATIYYQRFIGWYDGRAGTQIYLLEGSVKGIKVYLE